MIDPKPVPDAAASLLNEFTLQGVKFTILDEPDDVQVWVSLHDTHVPLGESFCLAGGDTRAEAFAAAAKLLREAAARFELAAATANERL